MSSVTFTERQRAFIVDQAQFTYDNGDLGILTNDDIVCAANVLDAVKGYNLPISWTPDEFQIAWISQCCTAFNDFWYDLLEDPTLDGDDLLYYADVREIVLSIRRDLIRVVF